MSEPLHYRSLAAVSADIASGELSSEEVTRHTLGRIATLEPKLKAFAQVRADAALAEAREADANRARGGTLGPLHGVPIAVKDLCALEGTATRAGGFFDTGFAPDQTATVVRNLQDAGAIVVGKAQLTEGAWGAHHPDIEPPVNPWSPGHWSGASSSGSGVSVAAGMAYGATGTDTAGSIRFPSTCNRLVGLKPTWGRVSRFGVYRLSDTLDHVGPMTRSVLDAALMFDAMAGPDPNDPTALDLPPPMTADAARRGSLKGVRVGLDPSYAFDAVEPVVADALKSALARMEGAGATIVEVRVPDVAAHLVMLYKSAAVEAAISHAATYPAQAERYSAGYRGFLELGLSTPPIEYAQVQIWRREFRGNLARLFKTVDMIATPTIPVPPLPVEAFAAVTDAPPEAVVSLMRFTIPFNAAGIPSLTLPLSKTPDGLPIAFQLLGPDLSEAALLAAGAGYELVADYAHDHPAL